MAWVRAVRRREHGAAGSGGAAGSDGGWSGIAAADAVRWAGAALVAAGLALGASAATGALSFQPRGRINVVAVLGVLVGLPACLLAVALLNALPPGVRRALPWIGSEPEGGGLLQPARWALRALPQRARAALEQAWGRGRAWERLTGPVRRWLLLSASQGAAVAFQVGALAAALALVVFSDLSFGWSTTLDVDPVAVHGLTDVVSAPWAWAWPDARPSLELVERTRFFRIASQPGPDVPPATYGGWWPFVAMCLAAYGLLPRGVFFGWARLRLRGALVRALVEAPGSARVLDRLASPLVETGAEEEPGAEGERGRARVEEERGTAGAGADAPLPTRAVVVSWAGAPGDRLGCDGAPAAEPLEAGGTRTPDDDVRTAARAAALAAESDLPIVVAVRGFEPPLAEVFDFLAALRDAAGRGRALVLAPLGGDAPEHAAWRRRVAAAGDPWLALAGRERAA